MTQSSPMCHDTYTEASSTVSNVFAPTEKNSLSTTHLTSLPQNASILDFPYPFPAQAAKASTSVSTPPHHHHAKQYALPLLTLPPELLALLPQYLPYQSTLRLLATCRYLRPLLSSSELASLRLEDADEIYKIELSTYAALTRRDDWRPQSRWYEPRFGVEEMPCYACLKWLVRFSRDSLSSFIYLLI